MICVRVSPQGKIVIAHAGASFCNLVINLSMYNTDVIELLLTNDRLHMPKILACSTNRRMEK